MSHMTQNRPNIYFCVKQKPDLYGGGGGGGVSAHHKKTGKQGGSKVQHISDTEKHRTEIEEMIWSRLENGH